MPHPLRFIFLLLLTQSCVLENAPKQSFTPSYREQIDFVFQKTIPQKPPNHTVILRNYNKTIYLHLPKRFNFEFQNSIVDCSHDHRFTSIIDSSYQDTILLESGWGFYNIQPHSKIHQINFYDLKIFSYDLLFEGYNEKMNLSKEMKHRFLQLSGLAKMENYVELYLEQTYVTTHGFVEVYDIEESSLNGTNIKGSTLYYYPYLSTPFKLKFLSTDVSSTTRKQTLLEIAESMEFEYNLSHTYVEIPYPLHFPLAPHHIEIIRNYNSTH